jgi:uncharacterized repeat protein (TIGR03803 family)
MRNRDFSIGLTAAALIAFTVLGTATRSSAQQEKVTHNFTYNSGPFAGVIFDAFGNLYGTTADGGTHGNGTVYELSPLAGGGWTQKILHNFKHNGTDGYQPYASLAFDAVGNLYGTTRSGGVYGYGTVFELTPEIGGSWTEKLLHSFNSNGTDGIFPFSSLVLDAAGNLYGTAFEGGAYGVGTVFELMPAAEGGWTEKVLYTFDPSVGDGNNPYAGLTFDTAGNLYGTTVSERGFSNNGTVFELTPTAGGGWTEKILHYFYFGGDDGYSPYARLTFDAAGNLYGATSLGGTENGGAVFELTPATGGSWTEKVLHNFAFSNITDGNTPYSQLIVDASGNLYGTTSGGGSYDGGTVFELTPVAGGTWTEAILHNFGGNGADGTDPFAGLTRDSAGNLYGTAVGGGAHGGGVVFEIKP